MAKELIDPLEPVESKLQHAFEKGWISRDDADQLLRTIRYAQSQAAELEQRYPGKVLAVVEDDVGEFRVLPGEDHLAAESQALEFFPDSPFAIAPTSAAFQPVGGEVIGKQDAKADGAKAQVDGGWTDAGGITKKKVWLVDTGASESMVSVANVIGAEVKIVGVAPVGGATGAANLLKIGGTKMTFPVEPAGGGAPADASCDLPMLLGPVDLLGRDQLKKAGVILIYDAAGGTTTLQKRPEKKKGGDGKKEGGKEK